MGKRGSRLPNRQMVRSKLTVFPVLLTRRDTTDTVPFGRPGPKQSGQVLRKLGHFAVSVERATFLGLLLHYVSRNFASLVETSGS
jgi:hypothetical protein